MLRRLIVFVVIITFILSYYQPVNAQPVSTIGDDFSINELPVPGTMVGESAVFAPLTLKGLVINLQKPLEFQFIVDTGHGLQDTTSVKDQVNQLVKYFLAGLTIPEGDLWVNLSPYEKNRMVPEALGQTDLGRDLLAQDYILKQLTASLIYPEKDLGKEFWNRVYARARKQFGTTNVPVNSFNKVWILPDQAQVFEHGAAAYVTKATLKVMLDEDYLAKQKHQQTQVSSISSPIVREILIPEITKEVNTGKNFAPLRQIYQALILAKWYKETIQNGLLDAIYTNKNKIFGVNLDDPAVKEQIYERYLKAYKKGAFNYIKEGSTPDGQVVPRKYFSGGLNVMPLEVNRKGNSAMVSFDGAMLGVKVDLQKSRDMALLSKERIRTILLNTFSDEEFEKYWPGLDKLRVFDTPFPAGFDEIWGPEDDAGHLFREGIPAVKEIFTDEEFEKYWPGLVELGMASGTNWGSLFKEGIPAVKRSFDKEFEKYWPDLVELGKVAGANTNDLFKGGLPLWKHVKSITVKDSKGRDITAQVDFININARYVNNTLVAPLFIAQLVESVVNYVMQTGRPDKRPSSVELYVTRVENNSLNLKMSFKDTNNRVISMVNISGIVGPYNDKIKLLDNYKIDSMVIHQGPLGGAFYSGIEEDRPQNENKNLVLIKNQRGRNVEGAEVNPIHVDGQEELLYLGESSLSKAIMESIRKTEGSAEPTTFFKIQGDSEVWKAKEVGLGMEEIGDELVTLTQLNDVSSKGPADGKHKVGVIFVGSGRYAVSEESHFKAVVDSFKEGKASVIGLVTNSIYFQGDVAKKVEDKLFEHLNEMHMGIKKGDYENPIFIDTKGVPATSPDWLAVPSVAHEVRGRILNFLKYTATEISDSVAQEVGQIITGQNEIKNADDLNKKLMLVDLYPSYVTDPRINENQEIQALAQIYKNWPDELELNRLRLNQLILEQIFHGKVPESKRVAFIITSRSKQHKPYVEWALQRGYHVLVDKPLTSPSPWTLEDKDARTIIDDAKRLMELSAQNPTVLSMMATQKRYSDAVKEICKNIKVGEEVKHISFVYNDGWWTNPSEFGVQDKPGAYTANLDGGKIAHSGYHFIDLIPWILQSAGELDKIESIDVFSTFQKPADIKAYNNLADRGVGNQESWERNGPNFVEDSTDSIDPKLHEINTSIHFNFRDRNGQIITTATLSMFHGGPFSKETTDNRGWGRVKTEEIFIRQEKQTIRYSRIAKFYMPKGTPKNAVGGKDHIEIVVLDAKGPVLTKTEDNPLPGKEFIDTLYSTNDLQGVNDLVRSPLYSHAIGIKLMAAIYKSVFARDNEETSKVVTVRIFDTEKKGIGKAVKKDPAMLHREPNLRDKALLAKDLGGIDLNQINVNRTGKTVNVQFDPAQLNALEQGGFQGFTPVITSMKRISSPFQFLGINTAKK